MILVDKKKIFVISLLSLIIYIITLLSNTIVYGQVTYEPENFKVFSKAAYLVNVDNGNVLYKKNEQERLPPASLTKIMTSIIVLETLPPEDLEKQIECYNDIMTNPYWAQQNASMSGFYPGEIVSIKNMIYALLIQSGCDMGDVLAKYTANNYMNGDIDTFIQKMNERAKELGANNTNFINTHGLDADGQYTTAYDMYLITKHALTLPAFLQIADTDAYYIAPTNKHDTKFPLINTNEMVFPSNKYYYEPIIPIKTGTTGINTHNLITLANKKGFTYMVVLLGAPYKSESGQKTYSTYRDTINLYEWAFNQFALRTILKKGETTSGVEVKVRLSTAHDYVIAVPEKTTEEVIPKQLSLSDIKKVSRVPESIDAPIKQGQILGSIDLMIGDEVLTTVNVVSSKDIGRSTILYIFDIVRKIVTSKIFGVIAIIFLVFIILYVLYLLDKNNKRRNKKKYNTNYSKRNRGINYKIEYYNPKTNKYNND